MSGHFPGSKTSAHVVVAPEGKCCKKQMMNYPLPHLFSTFIVAVLVEHIKQHGIPLWPFWISCFGYMLSQHIDHVQITGAGGMLERQQEPKHWFYQHLSSYQRKTQSCDGCFGKNEFNFS